MLWIFLTAAAAPLQVARNVMQRGLIGEAGPWGAALVRFLFGLPFSLAIFGVAALLTPQAAPHGSLRFWVAITVGAAAQVGATASLLVAMRRSGFAVATFMQQSSLPLAALVGLLVFHDTLSLKAWTGVALTTAGLAILSWPKVDAAKGAFAGSLLGLLSGAAFAVALNAYRQSGLALEPTHPIYSAAAGVCVAQAMQSVGLVVYLAATRPQALEAVRVAWRPSLGAGFFGASASACWFAALALAPAGLVRAVGVIEAPIAAATGNRLFREKLNLRQIVAGLATTAGVVMTAIG